MTKIYTGFGQRHSPASSLPNHKGDYMTKFWIGFGAGMIVGTGLGAMIMFVFLVLERI